MTDLGFLWPAFTRKLAQPGCASAFCFMVQVYLGTPEVLLLLVRGGAAVLQVLRATWH